MNMHGDEKSDEGVVPEKRPNNGSLLPAEAVEGRTSPKGNGGRTAAVRTQSRAAASNGLAAVRQAARQSKGVRFTALLHHLTVELLERSYFALKRNAAPGIDGVTWQAYGENLEENLPELHARIHRGRYRAAVLIVTVMVDILRFEGCGEAVFFGQAVWGGGTPVRMERNRLSQEGKTR